MAEPAYWASRKRAMSLSQTAVLNGIHITKTRVPLHKNGVLLFGFILNPPPPKFLFGAKCIPTALSRQKGVGKNFLAKRGEGERKQATGVCAGGLSEERGSNGKMEDKTGDKT